jgi:electron transfer flavoprotein beta subunit
MLRKVKRPAYEAEVMVKIIVPVKQAPESARVKTDSETGTVIRAGVPSAVNPPDLCAVEAALRLKEQYGGP